MKQRFILFRRGDTFYSEDTTTRKQTSLRTKDRAEAITLVNTKNEAIRQPAMNLQIAHPLARPHDLVSTLQDQSAGGNHIRRGGGGGPPNPAEIRPVVSLALRVA